MKDQKRKSGTKKPQNQQVVTAGVGKDHQQTLYLEHLMNMTVGVLDRGFQKN